MLFTLVTAALLAGAMGVVYVALARHAEEEDTRFLRDKLGAVQRDLREALAHRGDVTVLVRTPVGEAAPYFVRVRNTARGTVAETPGMSALAPVEAFAVSRERRTAEGKWLMLAAADIEGTPGGWSVQVAQDRTEDREFMLRFGVLLAGLVLAGIALAAWLARAVTRRGLRPLAEMAAAAERIHAAQLHERLATRGWPVELTTLAAAFDAMLARLGDSFARLAQFSADLAHELRTPLFNLRGEAEVALTQARTPDEYREVLSTSLEELDRLSRMTENLLFLARAEQSETRIVRQSLDARAEAEAVCGYCEAAAEERGVRLCVEGTARVEAEPILLRRVLGNLVGNALQHAPAGGTVTVRAAETDDGAKLEIHDTGAGIAAEHLPRLFDRFYRADASRNSDGIGLGLAIVKSIVELHGGSVAVSSEPGCGTTFTVSFPRN